MRTLYIYQCDECGEDNLDRISEEQESVVCPECGCVNGVCNYL